MDPQEIFAGQISRTCLPVCVASLQSRLRLVVFVSTLAGLSNGKGSSDYLLFDLTTQQVGPRELLVVEFEHLGWM